MSLQSTLGSTHGRADEFGRIGFDCGDELGDIDISRVRYTCFERRFAGFDVELLEPARCVDLENLGAVGAGEESVGHIPWEEDGLSGAQCELWSIARAGSDFAFKDVDDLVFAMMDVQRR